MKTLPALLIITATMIAFAADDKHPDPERFTKSWSPPLPASDVPGRFQLVSANYTIQDQKPRVETGLFRIDTATGRTWKLLDVNYAYKVPKDTEPHYLLAEGWVLISEDFSVAAEATSRAIEHDQTGRWPTNDSSSANR
jgi:hypothetical protein